MPTWRSSAITRKSWPTKKPAEKPLCESQPAGDFVSVEIVVADTPSRAGSLLQKKQKQEQSRRFHDVDCSNRSPCAVGRRPVLGCADPGAVLGGHRRSTSAAPDRCQRADLADAGTRISLY